jgi:hypothetical protein
MTKPYKDPNAVPFFGFGLIYFLLMLWLLISEFLPK